MFISIITDPSKIIPTKLTVNEGEEAVFVCLSFNVTDWYFENERLPSNAKTFRQDQNQFTLTIINTTILNQGYYKCEGFDENMLPFVSRAQLNVLSKPQTYTSLFLLLYSNVL